MTERSARPEDIDKGRVAEAHVVRTAEVLRSVRANPTVVAEVRASQFPLAWPWGVLVGTEEAVSLLEGRPVDAWGLPEGTVVYREEPVLVVSGRYLEFAELTTALAGIVAQPTGVATAAARLKLAASGRPVYAAPASRVHPAAVPVVEHAAYVGGCDAVTTILGAEVVGQEPIVSIDHDLALILGVPRAWTAFDQAVEANVPRIASVDGLLDERSGSLASAEELGDRLDAVLIDLSDRAEPARAVSEVRWELDGRGHSSVQILVSGNIDEQAIPALARVADGFFVDAPLVGASPVSFALDLVEVEGRPVARRGGLSGRKTLWRCDNCGNRGIAPDRAPPEGCPRCGEELAGLLVSLLERGSRGERPPEAAGIARDRALKEASAANR